MPSVGKTVPLDAAWSHVTGTAEYIADIPHTTHELVVGFFMSPEPHGHIQEVNLQDAQQVQGIVGLYTAQDLPGINFFGAITQDEIFLAENKVDYVGQPIVVIAGETYEAVQKAKKKIKISITPLKPIFTVEEAIDHKQFIDRPYVFERGDIQSTFQNPAHLLEKTIETGAQEHFYFEPQSAIVYPQENNCLRVISSTQNQAGVQNTIAAILNLPLNSISVETKRIGGGFGGKQSQGAQFAAMAALVAFKTKRPSRIALTIDEDMKVTGKRHPFKTNYKVAFSDEGKIEALEFNLYSNGGYANDYSVAVMGRAMSLADNAYYIPNIKITGTVCKTNYAPHTAFRGFGGPQAVLAIESMMEDIAFYLHKEPYEIRRINCYKNETDNITPYGQILYNNTLPAIMDQLVVTSDYYKRVHDIAFFNQKSTATLKGISLTPVKFGIGFEIRFLNHGSALVNIYPDGSIQVSTSGIEMGQGLYTKVKQVVAEEFAIHINKVRIMQTSTEKNHNAPPTAASTGSDFNAAAAQDACQKIKKRLIKVASEHLYPAAPAIEYIAWEETGIWDRRSPHKILTFEELVELTFVNSVTLGERGYYYTPGIDFDWETGKGTPFHYFTYGAAVSEIEIDKFTGVLKVLRSDLLMDIGNSINPGIDKGQIIGGFIQGMGWVTNEEVVWSDHGDLLTHSPSTYKIPNIHDIPDILHVDWIENNTNTLNIYQSKAVGEPPLLLAISVWTAIKNALSFVSKEEIPQINAPASAEEILTRITYYQRNKQSLVQNEI